MGYRFKTQDFFSCSLNAAELAKHANKILDENEETPSVTRDLLVRIAELASQAGLYKQALQEIAEYEMSQQKSDGAVSWSGAYARRVLSFPGFKE
jgi:hypothetical protein